MSNFNKAKPFIKWTGGKTALLGEVMSSFPVDASTRITRYVEPFIGGGAVLFEVLKTYPNIESVIISDINPRLINLYNAVKTSPDQLVEILYDMQDTYMLLSPDKRAEYYYEQRDLFNHANRNSLYNVSNAARFIFLNKTCFNGLYRENSKGDFNSPHGKYTKPVICDYYVIYADSNLLQKVDMLYGSFEQTLKYANRNTLYYLDPPYKPLANNNNGAMYTKDVFGDAEQIKLKGFCDMINHKGGLFIQSNSDPLSNSGDSFFDDLYIDYSIRRVYAPRAINCNGERRQKIPEIIISNVDNPIYDKDNGSLF